MSEYYNLSPERAEDYRHVFGEPYWWNPPYPDDFANHIDSKGVGRPHSNTQDVSVINLTPRNGGIILEKFHEVSSGTIFDPNHYLPFTITHSVVEGMHHIRNQRQHQKNEQPRFTYSHLDNGFMVTKQDETGNHEYFQGTAWHILLPTKHRGLVAAAILIDHVRPDERIALYPGDIHPTPVRFRTPSLVTYAQEQYTSWIVGQTTENRPKPLPLKRNEHWQQRFARTTAYTIKRSSQDGGRKRDPTHARSVRPKSYMLSPTQ